MRDRIFADLIIVLHFLWILFMVGGFIYTLCGFWKKGIFNRWLFRILHLIGIVYVGLLVIMGKSCPLTILENTLRAKSNPSQTYLGSFVVYYIEKLVYPNVNPYIICTGTLIFALSTVLLFFIRPPQKFKKDG